MRSRAERITWGVVAALAIAGAGAAWITRERWLPEAGPWLRQLQHTVTRPGPKTLPAAGKPANARARPRDAAAPPPPPRKCLSADGRATYTDQPCPPGSHEQVVEGAVTTVPAAPAQR